MIHTSLSEPRASGSKIEHICYLTSDIELFPTIKLYSLQGCMSKYEALPPDEYHIYEQKDTIDAQFVVDFYADQDILLLSNAFKSNIIRASTFVNQIFNQDIHDKDDILALSFSIDQEFSLPIPISHLPDTAFISIKVLLYGDQPFLYGTFPLFSDGLLECGQQRLLLNRISCDSEDLDDLQKRITSKLKIYDGTIGKDRSDTWLDDETLKTIKAYYQQISFQKKQFYITFGLIRFDEPVYYPPKPHKPKVSYISCQTVDPEMEFVLESNPIDSKSRQLTRSVRFGPSDKELKPSSKIRDQLSIICDYHLVQTLTAEEKDLIWRYRYYLVKDRKALSKLFNSMDWSNDTEWNHISQTLLQQWAKLETEDILELLSDAFCQLKQVREYAVKQLKMNSQNNPDLLVFMPQLVQASLLDDEWKTFSSKHENDNDSIPLPSLAKFIITYCSESDIGYIQLYWYLKVECESRKKSSSSFDMHPFQYMLSCLLSQVNQEKKQMLSEQANLIRQLLKIGREIKEAKLIRSKKQEKLYSLISDSKLLLFSPYFPLPLDPAIVVKGICASEATSFKSNLSPLKLPFIIANAQNEESTYNVIFKIGDDLRQDQLITQLIYLVDELLKKEHLDLKLTPYKVLATGLRHGMIQYVKSETLANILEEFSVDSTKASGQSIAIQSYLKKHNPKDGAPFGIDPDIMENYLCSCAGYSMITYILGVGDRHLDNLLLTCDGKLFHIDFAYILGSDPKPFPPPMKLCREMVEAMGGMDSVHFQKFKNYCYLAFCILRKSSHLLINLLSLMKHTSLPDIAIEPGDRVLHNILDKFRLDLNESEAHQYLDSLIHESVTALFPQMMEAIHKWAQYWRK